MASRGVSVLKFVGTVSLGLLTGFSYTLTTVTLPTLLALPSASSAAKAYNHLSAQAALNLRALTAVSSSAFLLAFVLSPRASRHPYLLYTSLLVGASSLAESIAPYVLAAARDDVHATAARQHRQQQQQQQQQARRRAAAAAAAAAAARTSRMMEASYEVLGDVHSEEGTAGSASGEDLDEEHPNGEEVRDEVEALQKTTVVRTAVAALGFFMAVVGIWGDGVPHVYATETFVIA